MTFEINTDPNNAEKIAEFWEDFVGWERRWEFEKNFLLTNVRGRVLDTCAGIGVEAVGLSLSGTEIVANEASSEFRAKLERNKERKKADFKISGHDWHDLPTMLGTRNFSTLLCLGNSLTYVFDKQERLRILRTFREVLTKSGILIVDERNYINLLQKIEGLTDLSCITPEDFKSTGEPMYCGQEIFIYPVKKRLQSVVFNYAKQTQHGIETITNNNRPVAVEMYPFEEGELQSELEEVFHVEVFQDFQKQKATPNFKQYICSKT